MDVERLTLKVTDRSFDDATLIASPTQRQTPCYLALPIAASPAWNSFPETVRWGRHLPHSKESFVHIPSTNFPLSGNAVARIDEITLYRTRLVSD